MQDAANTQTLDAETSADLFGFFEGETLGWGMFQDRAGRVKRTFQVSANGVWTAPDVFQLCETFAYGDGAREDRVWCLRRTDMGFIGMTGDCIGEADGRIGDQWAEMSYTFRLKLSNRTIDLQFRDRFFHIGRSGLMNRTRVTKWGLHVGDVIAFFHKPDAQADDLNALRQAELVAA